MTEKYQSPIDFQSLLFDTLAWKNGMEKKRQEVFSWTPEQIACKLKNLEKNIFALEDSKEPECSDFWGLLSCHGILSEEVQRIALEKEVYSLPEIYYHGSEEVERTLIQRISKVINPQEATELMACLAMQGGERALETLLDLEKNPRPWQKILFEQPADYAKYGGWTFDEKGERQILNYDVCYAMEKGDVSQDTAARIGRVREDFCPVCGCRLIDLLVLDGRDPRLAFLGIDGIFTVTCCPHCICTNNLAFCHFDLDGGSRVLELQGAVSEENQIHQAQLEEISSNAWVLGKEPVSIFFGAAWPDLHTVGGFAGWVEACSYTRCPHCGRVMKYVAQIQWDRILEGEKGTLFIQLCPECHIASVQRQYP